MKKILLGVFSLVLACVFNTSVNASSEIPSTVITRDTNENLVDVSDIEVEVNKGSTFTVQVPILSKIYSDWEKYKYCQYELSTSIDISGDIASNEIITVKHNNEIMMSAEGGLKDDIIWRASSPTGYLLESTKFNSKALANQKEKSIWVNIHPNKDTTAGLWSGFLHVTVSVEEAGIMLTKDQFKEYIESDATVTTLTIPKTITIDEKEIQIDGVNENTFVDFVNLTDIYLETDDLFKIQSGFGQRSLNKRTITIHGNNNILEMAGWVDVDGLILYDNVKISAVALPTDYITDENNVYIIKDYEEYVKDAVDENMIVYKNGEMYGYWDTYIMNPDTIYCSFGSDFNCTKINKVIIPELTYPDYMASFFWGTTIKEAECYNYFVGYGWFGYCNNLTKVTLHDGVEYIGAQAFANCPNLTEIIIPESVKYIDNTAFDGTPFLENLKKDVEEVYINGIWICHGDLYVSGETLVFPKNVNTLTQNIVGGNVKNLSFEPGGDTLYPQSQITSVITLDVTNRSISNIGHTFPNLQKLIIGGKTTSTGSFENHTNLKEIELVDGLKMINNYGFNHCTGYTGTSINIPSSVEYIGMYSTTRTDNLGYTGSGWSNHVFYDFGKDGIFKEFTVDEDSPYYTAVDGILYTKDMQAMIAIPRALEFENGVYNMPDEVRRLGELTFSRNPYIKEIIISDNLEIFNNTTELKNYYKDTHNDYITTLNEGNSLSLATYQFTNIEKYTVKDTNPNYTSIDGVIYTKDLKELVAIPNHYQGELIIPEGCVKWRENAMWIDSDTGFGVNMGITSITIPSTMTDIDERQLQYLNNFLYVSKVNIAEGNPVYTRFTEWAGIPRAVYKAQTLDNLAYTGTTGTYWYSSWGENIYTIGADINEAYASYIPIYLPEGMYSINFDYKGTDGKVWYHAVIGQSTGKTENINANEVLLSYTSEETFISIGEDGRFLFLCATIVNENNTAVYSTMTQEVGEKILQSLRITKISDNLIVKGSSWDGYGYTTTDSIIHARTKSIIPLDSSKTYKITFNAEDDKYWFSAFAFNNDNVVMNTDWKSTGTTITIVDANAYVLNFAYGLDRTESITYQMLSDIAKGLTIEEIKNHTHNYEATRIEADCIYDGSITYTCDCGHVYKTILPMSGHSYEEGVCISCGGVEIMEESGFYNLYGVQTYTWQDLINESLIGVTDDNLKVWTCTITETGTLVLDNSITTIGSWAFEGKHSLINIVLPDGLTTIEAAAFKDCTGLKELIIPNSVTSVGEAFCWACSGLESITLSNQITEIPIDAFSNCTSLKEINIPDNVTIIGNRAFNNCISLTSVTLSNSLTEIHEEAFVRCSALKELIIPNTVTTIGAHAIRWCNEIESIIIPEGVTSIERCCFSNNSKLKSIVLPSTLIYTGDILFYASGVTDIYISYEDEVPTELNTRTFAEISRNVTYHFKSKEIADEFETLYLNGVNHTISEDYNW